MADDLNFEEEYKQLPREINPYYDSDEDIEREIEENPEPLPTLEFLDADEDPKKKKK